MEFLLCSSKSIPPPFLRSIKFFLFPSFLVFHARQSLSVFSPLWNLGLSYFFSGLFYHVASCCPIASWLLPLLNMLAWLKGQNSFLPLLKIVSPSNHQYSTLLCPYDSSQTLIRLFWSFLMIPFLNYFVNETNTAQRRNPYFPVTGSAKPQKSPYVYVQTIKLKWKFKCSGIVNN